MSARRGVDPALLGGIVTAVDDYTIGYTIRELQAAAGAVRGRFGEPDVRYLLESGEFPLLSHFWRRRPAARTDFETGLAWLLDGFAAQLGL